MEWELKILGYILTYSKKDGTGLPFNISELSNNLEISQPICWRICHKLQADLCIVKYPYDDISKYSGGPEKIFYMPTIDCLSHSVFVEQLNDAKKQLEQGINEPRLDFAVLDSYKQFKFILDIWWDNPVFINSICNRRRLTEINDDTDIRPGGIEWTRTIPELMPEKIVTKDPEKAKHKLKIICEYLVRVKHEYRKIRNDMDPFYENLLGEHHLLFTDPDYYESMKHELYSYFTPYTETVDALQDSTIDEYNRLHERLYDDRYPANIEELKELRSQINIQIKQLEQREPDDVLDD